ncbi:MAG: NADH-quinone oxidoreductase subunit J [Alicyclobacillus macrosporangiidus]|uniref:NADH-quinone oxidoreductase subunit J n=1 Tax=Alicyclobacillus macrosporangiidus TaxID=392015 RepID=UPI0026EF2E91|nr:NADH-quinone oxidoreductase subunit J [Alicyclobacillus macrosporangiidus]MCL6599370.1 NADH-quinone oxidoreductase subunit J [Alicyclobacillus macrosporangiidus]
MHFFLNAPMIGFYIISLFILGCAVMLLSFQRVIYMALAIGGVFIGCAAIYILLGADFVGAAQLLIYAGAITILIMFAIMLTNHEAADPPHKWTVRNILSAVAAVLLGAVLLLVIRSTTWPPEVEADVNGGNSNPVAVGLALFQNYTVPFELVSLLLIVGMVGAVILARERKEDEEE